LWPIPLANLAFKTGSVKSGFLVTDILCVIVLKILK
jgi:hypothetical protein